MSERILIVDALNLFIRHYVRNPAMTTNGQHAGGIVGFLNALKSMVNDIKPTRIFVVWEGGGSSRKRSIYKDYKSQRKPPKMNRFYEDIPDSAENKTYQISVLTNVLMNVPVCQIYVPDCEADDVIGYICNNMFHKEQKIIASSDKDFYQLLSSNIIQYSLSKHEFVTCDDVLKQFNITSQNFLLAKAICGDASDNVPGVKNVGFKTLAKRFTCLAEHRDVTLDDILNECSKLQGIKAAENILNSVDDIKRNMRLMRLDIANMAATQVHKVESICKSFEPFKNKIRMMKLLSDEGLTSFNAHDFYSSFNNIH
jgi:DNA polymerase-1